MPHQVLQLSRAHQAPGCVQGGPHNHQIAALCVALKHCKTSEFIEYQKQVVRNTQALAKRLTDKGYKMATGGSDNHLILWDLRDQGVTGSKMQAMCDAAHITLNMNSVAGDVSAMTPGGVRIGMPAMTSRGLKEADFEQARAAALASCVGAVVRCVLQSFLLDLAGPLL